MGNLKTIVVTGATGYLGSKLMARLLADNYNVIVIKREGSVLDNISQYVDIVNFYNNDEQSIAELFNNNQVDLLIHMATLYGRKGETALEIKQANLDFPLNLLLKAIDHGVKYIINTSTSLPINTNQYALFKNQFSQCLNFFGNRITSISILLEHFYGPDDDKSKFVTAMINKMLDNESPVNLTAGIQLRDFIFIEDVLDAFMVMINKIVGLTGYNELALGTGKAVSIRSIVEDIKELSKSVSELNFGAVPMRDNELMESNADISKLNELGWQPKTTLKEGLKLTIESEIKKRLNVISR